MSEPIILNVATNSAFRAQGEKPQRGNYKARLVFGGQTFDIEGRYDLGETAITSMTIESYIKTMVKVHISEMTESV